MAKLILRRSGYSRSSLRRNTKKESLHPQNSHTSIGSVITVMLGILSLLSIALILLGLGSALALNELFGIEPLEVFRSPFDFLVESYRVILAMVYAITYSSMFQNLGTVSLLIAGPLMTIPMLCIFYLLKTVSKTTYSSGPLIQKTKGIWKISYFQPLIVTIISWTTSSALIALAPWLVLTALVFVSLFPLIGLHYGKLYFYDSVINPTRCESANHLKQRQPSNRRTNIEIEATATCLRIRKDGNNLGVGRRIIRTSDTVFLYDPKTGATLSVPVKDSIVEQVDKL